MSRNTPGVSPATPAQRSRIKEELPPRNCSRWDPIREEQRGHFRVLQPRGYRWLTNWALDKTIKYGYQTVRALAALVVVFVAFWLLAIFAQHHQLIAPVAS